MDATRSVTSDEMDVSAAGARGFDGLEKEVGILRPLSARGFPCNELRFCASTAATLKISFLGYEPIFVRNCPRVMR